PRGCHWGPGGLGAAEVGPQLLRSRVDERMSDPDHVPSETARVVPALLEAEEHEDRPAESRDLLRARRAPRPYLRRDEEDDRDPRGRQAPCERDVEVRRVDEDGPVDALVHRLGGETLHEPRGEAELPDRLDQADDRQLLLVRQEPHAPRGATVAGDAERL